MPPGAVVDVCVPSVLTSRPAFERTRIASCAVAVLLGRKRERRLGRLLRPWVYVGGLSDG